jgi:hypothetical protein
MLSQANPCDKREQSGSGGISVTTRSKTPDDKPLALDVIASETVDLVPVQHLQERFQRLYRDIVLEVRSIRDFATASDLELARSAAEASEAEHNARIFASEAAEIGDKKALLEFSRLAQSERRAKSDSLGRLGCSGERPVRHQRSWDRLG